MTDAIKLRIPITPLPAPYRLFLTLLAALTVWGLCPIKVAYADPGDLDTTFSSDGKVITAIGSGSDYGQAIAVQSDGKIVVAGYSSNGSNNDFALVRYNSDGSLDTSFDTDGIVTTAVGSTYDVGQAVAVQSDGKIVVAGYSVPTGSYYYKVVVLRYTTTGSLDTGFDDDGIVTTSIGNQASSQDYGHAVAIQSDGKIVVAGTGYFGLTHEDFAVVRYSSDGSLDTSFGGDGIVTTAVGTSTAKDEGYAAAIQSDGKIVVVGYSGSSNYDIAVARYNVTSSSTQTIANAGGSATLEDVTITNYSTNSCVFTVTKYPVPPGGAPMDPGEMPVQWNITTDGNCGVLNVDLAFHYSDTELANGNNIVEGSLKAFKHTTGQTWANQGGAVDTGANTVTLTGVSSLSSWTLGDPSSSGNSNPSIITLRTFAGRPAAARPGVLAAIGVLVVGALVLCRRRKQ